MSAVATKKRSKRKMWLAGRTPCDAIGMAARQPHEQTAAGQRQGDTLVGPARRRQSKTDATGHSGVDTLGATAGRDDSKGPQAKCQPSPIVLLPAAPRTSDEAEGDHTRPDTPTGSVSPAIIEEIRLYWRLRKDAMKSQVRQWNQWGARIRGMMGWKVTLPKKELKRIEADATKLMNGLVRALRPLYRAGTLARPTDPAVRALVLFAIEGSSKIDERLRPFATAISFHHATMFDIWMRATETQEDYEETIKPMVRSLPAWQWVSSIDGVGEIGLATYVGEAGDLSGYANPGKLWKRMGLAPPHAYPFVLKLKKKKGEDEAKEVKVRAIPRERRAMSWRIASSLFKFKNEYQDLYYDAKAKRVAKFPELGKGINPDTGRIMSVKKCDMWCRRYAEKRFVKHLWQVWHKAARGEALVPDPEPTGA